MSRDSKRLDVVKQVFARRELDIARRLGECQTQLDEATRQLQLLSEHRARHAAGAPTSGATNMGILQNQQVFNSRLNAAISQQESLIRRAKIQRDEIRRTWLARRSKTQAVEKLGAKWRAAEHQQELTREQKQQDDLIRGGQQLKWGSAPPDTAK